MQRFRILTFYDERGSIRRVDRPLYVNPIDVSPKRVGTDYGRFS